MAFPQFLSSRRSDCKALAAELKKTFTYVSVLGVDVKTSAIRVDKNTSSIGPGRDTECGFVVKMHNGSVFYEYALDDICGDIATLAEGDEITVTGYLTKYSGAIQMAEGCKCTAITAAD
mgnify:CR=1 FL=1